MPRWIRLAEAARDRRDEHYTSMWLERVRAPQRRNDALRDALARARTELAELPHGGASQATLDQFDSESRKLRGRLAELQPVLAAERASRKKALADLLAREEALRRGSWGVDDEADRELRELHKLLRRRASEIAPSSESAEAQNLREQLKLLDRLRRAELTARGTAEQSRKKLQRRIERLEWRLRSPHLDNPPPLFPREIRPTTLLPDGLDTVAWGKVGESQAFQFLATQGGMWSVQHADQPWAHSLVGPTWIMEDLLLALTEALVSTRPTWALAGRGERLAATTGPRSPAVAIGFAFPALANATLTDAVAFRRRHEEELTLMRRWVQTEIEVVECDDLEDQAADLRHRLAEPIAEVRRALELDQQLGLRTIAVTTLRHAPRGAKSLAAGAAASIVAMPIVGPTISAASVVAGVVGTPVLAGMRAAGRGVVHAHERRGLRASVDRGPTRYLYEVGLSFGLA